MSDSRMRDFLIVARRALRTPTAVGLLGAGLVLAFGLHSLAGLAILLAAILGTAGFCIAKLNDSEFVRSALEDAREHAADSDAMNMTFRIEELDVDSRIKMKSIIKLQHEMAEDVASSAVEQIAEELEDTLRQTRDLVERGLRLSQKRRELVRYLNKTNPAAIQARIDALSAGVHQETDQDRRGEMEVSLAAKEQELKDYQAIAHAASRVLDQLDSIECSFAGLRARIVRMKSSDIAEWTSAHEQLKTELGGLTRAADVVEQSIEEAISIGMSNE